jgi:cold-inducible RNA-binding protein
MNIYAGNIARTVSEETLRELFAQYGQVDSVKMIKDHMTGELRGFAFITMPNNEEAQAAMDALNNYDLEGHKLRVNEAREQERGPRRSFGDGGGRGGDYSRSRGGGMGGGGYGGKRSSDFGSRSGGGFNKDRSGF